MNGDWYGSQKDATVTNHFRIGTGAGNERGLLNRYQSDYGYRWTTGLSDATAGEQFYQILDELNDVYRISIGQYNHGQSSTNNQTVINAAGTGAVVLNGSANSGSGGVIFGAGGSTGAAVATINNAGNAQFNGSLQVGGPSTFTSTATVKNQADAEIDHVLWAGATTNQKESYIYKDYTGASQWYMVKDASNNWALNSALGGLDSFKAYQSNNSGDTYINASKGTGHIRLNYETGSGAETDIYSGSSSTLVAAFLGSTAIKFPGLAASGGHNCLQIDNSGYISNTGSTCGTGSGGTSGTVNSGNAGQVAYYEGDGTVIAGMTSVGVAAGGTGATTAAQALLNLGAQPAMAGVASDGAAGVTVSGNVSASGIVPGGQPVLDIRNPSFAGGAICDGGTHSIDAALQAAWNALPSAGGEINIIGGSDNSTTHSCYWANPTPYDAATNPTGFNWAAKNGPITLHVQGFLRTGTTLYIPPGTQLNLLGMSGNNASAFQSGGQNARVGEWPVSGTDHGTLGSNVNTTTGSISSGTNTLTIADGTDFVNGNTIIVFGAGPSGGNLQTTVSSGGGTASLTLANSALTTVSGAVVNNLDGTQTSKAVTLSTMTNVYPGTAITIAGTCTATIGSISRASNKVAANVTWAPNCEIPAAAVITVAGVSDTSFNGSFTLQSSDYVANAITWNQTAPDSNSSGGTATGFNEATEESALCTATTATTCTATFFRPHSSADLWGIVGVDLDNNTVSSSFKDLTISGGGAQIWVHQTYLSKFENIAAQTSSFSAGQWYVVPFEMTFGNFVTCSHCTFVAGAAPWALHLYGSYNAGYTANGPFWMEHSFISAGIKLDHGATNATVIDTVVEHAARGIVQFDPNFQTWSGSAPNVKFDYTGAQDNGSYPTCMLYSLFPSAAPDLTITRPGGQIQCSTNSYYQGRVRTDTPREPFSTPVEAARGAAFGTNNDGVAFLGELRGLGAGLGPSTIPYATANITTNPANWSTGATCSLSSSTAMAPDGSATAGALTGTGAGSFSVGNSGSITPAVGDMILYGGWIYTPTAGQAAVGGAGGEAFEADTNSSTHFQIGYTAGQINAFGQAITNNWDSALVNDGWHPVVGYAQITQSDGTGGQQIRLQLQCASTKTLEYWQPFLMYVPASSGITRQEVMRWRQDLLHGAVPSNFNSPGVAATVDPVAANGYYNQAAAGGAPNLVIPNYITGYLGNTSGVDIPFAIPWSSPTSLVSICHDANGNLVDNGCPSGGNVSSPGSGFTAGHLISAGNAGGTSIADSNLAAANVATNQVPAWLLYLGDGSEAAPNCASGCSLGNGEHWYSSLTIPAGQVGYITYSGQAGITAVIRSTGTCTIAGTLSASVNSGSFPGITGTTNWGGGGGGGGYGAANGSAGTASTPLGGGSAGTSGNAGGVPGGYVAHQTQTVIANGPPSVIANYSSGYAQMGGGQGGQGGSSGGAGGKGGGAIVLDCATINFTGTIDVSGQNGIAGGSNTGGGGGGGGGFVILRSPNLTNSGTINVSRGTGGAAGIGTSTAGGNGAGGWSRIFNN